VQTRVISLGRRFKEFSTTASDIAPSARIVAESLIDQSTSLDKALGKLQIIENQTGAAPLVGALRALDQVYAALQTLNFTASRKEAKQSLYPMLETQLKCLERLPAEIAPAWDRSLGATQPQIDQIRSLAQMQLVRHADIVKKLAGMTSEYNRKAYTERLATIYDTLVAPALENVTSQYMPELKFQASLDFHNASDLTFLLLALTSELRSESQDSMSSALVIATELQPLLRGVAYGRTDELARLSNTASALQSALQSIESLPDALKTLRALLGKIISSINDMPVRRSHIRASAESSEKAIATLDKLQRGLSIELMRRIHSDEDYRALNTSIDAFAQDIVALRHVSIASSAQLDTLLSSAQAVKESYSECKRKHLVGINTAPCIRAIDETLSRIRTLHAQIESTPLRFAVQTVSQNQLWVRIYPDQISIDSHDPSLTATEVSAGMQYWQGVWLAAGDEDLEKGSWRTLCAAFGAPRASWIAKQLKPPNLATASHPSLGLGKAVAVIGKLHAELTGGAPSCDRALEQIRQVNSLLPSSAILVQSYLITKMAKQIDALEEVLAGERVNVRSEQRQSVVGALVSVRERLAKLNGVDTPSLIASTSGQLIFNKNFTTRTAPWPRPAQVAMLPDRFVAITMRDGGFIQVSAGLPIGRVSAGLDISSLVGDSSGTADGAGQQAFQLDPDGNLILDSDIAWMMDFQSAVDKGMAIAVPISPEDAKRGFDKVLVLGLRSGDVVATARDLASLFVAHHYSDGLSLLPVGTPTNNTDNHPAGFASKEDFDTAFAHETVAKLFDENDTSPFSTSDGKRLADLLGVPYDVFQNVEGAGLHEISDALAVNRALWAGTIGYHMEDILDRAFTLDAIDYVRQFFLSYVVGRGIAPSIRIGRQPYGVLPTTLFSRILNVPLESIAAAGRKSKLSYDLQLRATLSSMYTDWKALMNSHVKWAGNLGSTDVQRDFLEMLGMCGTSVEYHYRYGWNLGNSYGSKKDRVLPFDPKYAPEAVLQQFPWVFPSSNIARTRAFRLRFFDNQQLISVTGDESLGSDYSLVARSDDNALASLLQQPLGIVSSTNVKEGPSHSPAFLLFRNALLLEYRDIALRILFRESLIDGATRRMAGEPEYCLAYWGWNFPTMTRWRYLLLPLSQLDGKFEQNFSGAFYEWMKGNGTSAGHSMADYLNPTDSSLRSVGNFMAHQREEFSRLDEFRTALQHVSGLSVEQLDRLVAEHLDLCSYRLDAWILGLANRLVTTSKGQGVFVGAYGWVEDLRPESARVEAAQIPIELYQAGDPPVYVQKGNEGFIHAASINNAVTAAVLRSSYSANASLAGVTNRLSINLSSARVRMARLLLEEVNSGQEVGDVLGYQFERGLHEGHNLELDKYIYALRRMFPSRGSIQVQPAANDSTRRPGVVNGLALLEEARASVEGALQGDKSLYSALSQNCPAFLKGLNGITPPELDAILTEIDRMANAFDALGDLLLAEAVHQLGLGNHARAAAFMNALGSGKRIPDPEIAETRRDGVAVTCRVVSFLEPISGRNISLLSNPTESAMKQSLTTANAIPVGWDAERLTPRAYAEPSLNYWFGKCIGPAAHIACTVHAGTGETRQSVSVYASELGLQPIDVIALLTPNVNQPGADLAALVALTAYGKLHTPIEPGEHLTVNFTQRGEDWTDNIRSFFEVMPLAQALMTTLGRSRQLTARDLGIPASGSPTLVDTDELRIRISDAKARLQKLKEDLTDSRTDLMLSAGKGAVLRENEEFITLRELLLQALSFGCAHAIPAVTGGTVTELVAELRKQIAGVVQQIDQKLIATERELAKGSDLDALENVGKAVFGKAFVALPQFSAPNSASDLISKTFDNVSENDLEAWLHCCGKVRSNLASLESLSLLGELVGCQAPVPTAAQLPYVIGESWMGSEFPATENAKPKLAFCLLNARLLSMDSFNVGVVVDEWVETIPSSVQRTGLCYNYDQPDATAPQALMLALSSGSTGKWNWDDLVYTMLDTLTLAKIRAVEPDHVQQLLYSQLLPALCTQLPIPGDDGEVLADLGCNAVTHVDP
jgi:hypothetical protein